MAKTKAADTPFTAKEQRFIHYYVNHRLTHEVEWIAATAGFAQSMGKRLYKREDIRAEIDRRIAVEEQEQARLKAQEIVLSENLLDRHLLEIIQLDAKAFAREKLNALKFGYVVAGKIKMGSTEAVQKPDTNPNHQQNFYQAFETTTTTTREVTAGVVPPLPVPEARKLNAAGEGEQGKAADVVASVIANKEDGVWKY